METRILKDNYKAMEKDHVGSEEQSQLSDGDENESTQESLNNEEWRVPEQNAENLFQFWEESVQRLRDARLSVPSQETISLNQKLADARIGGALVRFCGVGDVHGVVDLSGDPNSRGNPRPLMMSHVDALANNLRRRGAKRDHEAPVILMARRDLIDNECLEAMGGKNARDATAVLPFFQLTRKLGSREDELEERLWSQRVDRRMLSDGELQKDRDELEKLRAGRLRATLMNGNHRFQAMLRLGSELEHRRDELNRMLDSSPQGMDTDTIRHMMEALNKEVMELTWRVEVYDESMVTGEIKNALVKNEDEKPAEGMGAGEKAWWTAELFAVRIEDEMLRDRTKSREDAASIVAAAWQKEMGEDFSIGVVEEVTDTAFVKGGLRAPRNSPVGPENISKLFKESTCMEMVLNTRSALWIWSNCLTREQATLMLKPRGAALVAHFWLSILTALKVFNVQHPKGLDAAEAYLRGSKLSDVGDEGDQAAREHWNKLHARHEQSPQPLSLYDERAQRKFGSIYRQATGDPELGQDIMNSRFENQRAVTKMREVFEMFASHFQGRRDVVGRAVSASLRLYARLPLHGAGQTGDCFYPEATLPSTDCMRDLEARWNKLEGIHGETLAALEVLISKQNIAWTVGALGSSQATNTRNWYNRSRALHQIVRHCYGAAQYGGVEARLSQALRILQDPKLVTGLAGIALPVSNRLRQLIVDCSASKSGKSDYPILSRRLVDWPQYRSVDLVRSDLAKFRMALKHAVRSDNPFVAVSQAVKDHPVSQTVNSEFWETFNLVDWVRGWNDKHKDKAIKTVSAAVGWGYVVDALCDRSGLPLLLKAHPTEAHAILLAAERLSHVKQQDPWWKGMVSLEELVEAEKSVKQGEGGHGDSLVNGLAIPQSTEATGSEDRTPAVIQGRKPRRRSGRRKENSAKEVGQPRKKTPFNMVVEVPGPEGSASPDQATSRLARETLPPIPESSVPEPSVPQPPEPSAPETGPGDVQREPRSLRWPGASGLESDTRGTSPRLEHASGTAIPIKSGPTSPSSNEQLEEAYEGGWDLLPTLLGSAKQDLAWQTRPGYLLASAAYSTRVLQNLDGQVLMSQNHRVPNNAVDEETIRRIREARMSHPKVIEGIVAERDRLRRSIHHLATACASMPYGYDWFQSGFQAALANMKDLYSARVAGLFMNHLGVSVDEALNEALSISWTDGLHVGDMAWLDEYGDLQVDFATTLTSEVLSEESETQASYGQLAPPMDQMMQDDDIPSTVALLKSKFRVARGYGSTEKACELAGVEAVILRAKILEAKLQGKECFVGMAGPGQLFLESEEGVDEAVKELLVRRSHHYRNGLSFGPERRRTRRRAESAFCTGTFVSGTEELSQGPAGPNRDRLRKELELTLGEVREAWKNGSDSDLQAFKRFRQGKAAREGSYT